MKSIGKFVKTVLQLLSESFEPVKAALINLTAIVQGSDKKKAWEEYLQKTSELLEIVSVYGSDSKVQ